MNCHDYRFLYYSESAEESKVSSFDSQNPNMALATDSFSLRLKIVVTIKGNKLDNPKNNGVFYESK